MIVRFEVGEQFIHGGCDAGIGDAAHKIGVAFAFADGFELVCHRLLQHGRHPHHALEAAVR